MSKKQIAGIGVVVLLIAAFLGIQVYASNVAEQKVDKTIARSANFADIDYKKVRVGLLGTNVKISDVVVSPVDTNEKIKIGEVVIHQIDNESDVPSFLSASCNAVELHIQDFEENEMPLREMGYNDKLMANLNVDYAYDLEDEEIKVKDFSLGINEMGKISASFRLGNIALGGIGEIMGLLYKYPQVMFHEAKIEYNDDSFVDRFLKYRAEQEQVSMQEFKKMLAQGIDYNIERTTSDFAKKALSEINNFLQDPEQILILVSPSKPHPVGRIMRINNPQDGINLLNIQIKS